MLELQELFLTRMLLFALFLLKIIRVVQKKVMKKFLYAICFIFGLAFSAQAVNAATEFISTIDPDNAAGTDYTSLSAWEGAVQADLTSASTSVFSYSTASGTIPDLAGIQGETSGATASSTHMTASTTSSQILLTNIVGTFQSGETVYIQGQATSTTYVILSNTGDSAIAVATCRSTGGTADTAAVDIDGWTTSATNYIKIWTDPDDVYGRHGGKWDEGKYRLEVENPSAVINIAENYTHIEGLQIQLTAFDFSSRRGIRMDGYDYVEISHNIIKGVIIGTSDTCSGIHCYNTSTDELKIWNNIIYDFVNDTKDIYGIYLRVSEAYVYNNTIYNSYTGIYDQADSRIHARNNITQFCATSFSGTFDSSSTNNLSDDATYASSTADIVNTEVVLT